MGRKKGKAPADRAPEETQQGPPPGSIQQSNPLQAGPPQSVPQRGSSPGFGQRGPPPGFGQRGPPPGFGQRGSLQGYRQRAPPPGFGQEGQPQGFTQQGPPPGFRQGGQSQGFRQQGTSPGFGQGGEPQGYRQRAPPPGFGQEGQPQGFTQQGPPPGFRQGGQSQGFRQQGTSPGFGQGGEPQGFRQRGPRQGFRQQGPPPDSRQQGPPPPGFGQQGPSSSSSSVREHGIESGGQREGASKKNRGTTPKEAGYSDQQSARTILQDPPPAYRQAGSQPSITEQGPSSSSISEPREQGTQFGGQKETSKKKKGKKPTQAEPGPSGGPPKQQETPPPPTSKASSSGDGLKKREIIPYIGKEQIPRRKGTGGTLGRPVMLEVNYLPLKIKLDGEFIHYDCAIDPDTPKAAMPKVFEQIRLKEFPNRHPAFDGRRNMYSSGLIKFRNGKTTSGEVSVIMESGGEKVFKYAIKEANRIYFSQLALYMKDGASTQPASVAMQALDIALGSTPLYRSLQVGRSFFNEPREEPFDLGEGMVLWGGYFQSAIMASKSYLNVDVAHKAFPKGQSILDYMKNDLGVTEQEVYQGLNRNTEQKMKRYLKGLKVRYSLNAPGCAPFVRSYKVVDLTAPPATVKFKLDGVDTTVKDYFLKEKKYKIKYDQLPCLHVGAKEKNIQVPMELCSVLSGQAVMKQLTERQTANMVRQAATKPFVRKKKIMDSVRTAAFRNDPCLREFGIEVDERFEKVSARVLDPPVLEYKGGKTVKPDRGQWKADKLHFYKPVELRSWVVLNLCTFINSHSVQNVVRGLIGAGRDVGVMCADPRIDDRPNFRSGDERSLRLYLEDLKKRSPGTQMVLVIMENVYAQVKRTSEIYVGILTQCIKGGTVKRFNYSIAYNMMLKINTKLNGINHIISKMANMAKCLPQNSMVIGADVTHPSPDKSEIPSIAAVAASYDETFVQHNIISRLQGPRVEIIDDFCNIMMEQLRHYFLRNGKHPDKLFFFRDGVSEGQFSQVLDHELIAARKACTSIRPDYKPQMTFLVVQKRHHARLFPVNERDGDRNGNIQAGTIVDKQIVHPTEMEYFLASHASIQGTCRPTKYHVLYDNSGMTEDELEHLTYYLCFVFARCNRSVSYPAPTYNAHLAAFRSRSHIEGIRVNIDDLSKEQRHVRIIDEFHKNNPMFFV